RIAVDDAEPVAVALEGVAIVLVAHRERPDDAEPGHAGKNFRSAQRRLESLLYSRIRRRGAAGRPVHPRAAAVPAAARLGTVAIDPQEAAGHQRSRRCNPGHAPPYR